MDGPFFVFELVERYGGCFFASGAMKKGRESGL